MDSHEDVQTSSLVLLCPLGIHRSLCTTPAFRRFNGIRRITGRNGSLRRHPVWTFPIAQRHVGLERHFLDSNEYRLIAYATLRAHLRFRRCQSEDRSFWRKPLKGFVG